MYLGIDKMVFVIAPCQNCPTYSSQTNATSLWPEDLDVSTRRKRNEKNFDAKVGSTCHDLFREAVELRGGGKMFSP
jgi:hypothetical protein